MTHAAVSFVWGAPAHGLRLGVAVAGTRVTVVLDNAGAGKLLVMSHVAGIAADLDWHRFQLDHAAAGTRELRASQPRNRSAPVRVELAPGDQISHQVDLAELAMRPSGGGRPLAPGAHTLRASYEVLEGVEPGTWTGHLDAPAVTIHVAP